MNSVSPSAVQYVGGALQEELLDSQRTGSPARRLAVGPEAATEPDEVDKLKAKLMSAWNNVKYGWWSRSMPVCLEYLCPCASIHPYLSRCIFFAGFCADGRLIV